LLESPAVDERLARVPPNGGGLASAIDQAMDRLDAGGAEPQGALRSGADAALASLKLDKPPLLRAADEP
jgi:hypothetical protein